MTMNTLKGKFLRNTFNFNWGKVRECGPGECVVKEHTEEMHPSDVFVSGKEPLSTNSTYLK